MKQAGLQISGSSHDLSYRMVVPHSVLRGSPESMQKRFCNRLRMPSFGY